jgi:hypothetical protein
MHDKLPTDDNLLLRGCHLPSVCNLCFQQVESSFHLFFGCSYAVNIWTWFAETIGMNLNFNSIKDICLLCDKNWKPQCKVMIQAPPIGRILACASGTCLSPVESDFNRVLEVVPVIFVYFY